MGTNERHGTQEADMKRVKVLTRVPLGIIAATDVHAPGALRAAPVESDRFLGGALCVTACNR